MATTEHPLQALAGYLPDGSFDHVAEMIQKYKVHLTVTRARKTVLGDYRHSTPHENHRITVNGNLNKYEFLITLLHELAHLLTYEQFRNKVEPHGQEWKNLYGKLLINFIALKIFPSEIEAVLQRTVLNPSATANGETALLRILRSYNPRKPGHHWVEEIPEGSTFLFQNGKTYQKGARRRKRYECVELASKRIYLFNPLSEVKLIEAGKPSPKLSIVQ